MSGRQHNGTASVPAVRQHEDERVQLPAAGDQPVRARREDVRDERREHAGSGQPLHRLLGARHPGTYL